MPYQDEFLMILLYCLVAVLLLYLMLRHVAETVALLVEFTGALQLLILVVVTDALQSCRTDAHS